ncbi:peptide deformylase [Chitinophaga pinensis]|uniref:Peptide deformylase n=1 Tax=Chitinophaga pinensis TaxID=79329 RepID=A0A5C6LYM0_9BACT|nr:peptide deformylase [Chitinophaga pinensis]TWW02525.1 peptide deformylase [Chitinophaga pinensis]
MIRPIVAYGTPILRQQTAKLNPSTPGLPQLIADMWQTLDNTGGVGLAAPQVNVSLRLFLVDNRLEATPLRQVFINPRITAYGISTCMEEEGCLSIPGLSAFVTRPEHISLSWQDEQFRHHSATFAGVNARIIQHEYDHIQGRLYTDLLPPLSRTLLKHKLQAISKGKIRPGYPMQFPLHS